jgi:hypothetical protein
MGGFVRSFRGFLHASFLQSAKKAILILNSYSLAAGGGLSWFSVPQVTPPPPIPLPPNG